MLESQWTWNTILGQRISFRQAASMKQSKSAYVHINILQADDKAVPLTEACSIHHPNSTKSKLTNVPKLFKRQMHQKCFLIAWKPKALEVTNFAFLQFHCAAFLPNNQTTSFPRKPNKSIQIYLIYLTFYLSLNKWNQWSVLTLD